MSEATLTSTRGDYRRLKEQYEEFKKLRKELGKPLRGFIDPEATKKDLEGEDFVILLEELKKTRDSETRRLGKSQTSII